MKKQMYLILAVIGLIVPYYFLIDHFMDYGFDLSQMIEQLFESPISTFFVADVVIAAIVVLIFIVKDSKEIKVKFILVPIIATLFVGVSCGLPLYLFLREIERASWTETL